ncbi:MAG: LptF/LptG family permease [Planctomycetota bacterium]
MKRLDLYVGKIVLGAFLASMLFFLFLMVVVDVLTNLAGYAERAERAGIGGLELAGYLGLYYVKLLPVLVTMVTPFACVIAGMFAVARLHNANEIVPMLFVGRSIHRVLRPILFVGLLGAVLMAVSWQWIVPHVGADLATSRAFLRAGAKTQQYLVYESHGEKSQHLYVLEYDPAAKRMIGVRMLIQGVLRADATLITADVGNWDEELQDWRLDGGKIQTPRSRDRRAMLGRPDVTPALLVQQGREQIDPETLSYSDLLALLDARPNRVDARLALHRHMTYPLACLLLLLLALPLAIRYERGSRTDRLLAAIGLCAGYMLVDLACQRLGGREWLHPIVAAWTPTIVFGSLGVVLFGSTKS